MVVWVDLDNVRDVYEFNEKTNELSMYGKVIGKRYNHFVAIADDTGVIDYGYFEKNEFGTKPIKLNKKKLRKGLHRLYDIRPHDVKLLNLLHKGFDIEKYLLDNMHENLKNSKCSQYQDCLDMFNELVLTDGNKLERVIGFSFDTSDVYYMTKDDRGKITNHTGVGGLMRLKDTPGYDRWYSCFSYSNSPEVDFKFKLLTDYWYHHHCNEISRWRLHVDSILWTIHKLCRKTQYKLEYFLTR